MLKLIASVGLALIFLAMPTEMHAKTQTVEFDRHTGSYSYNAQPVVKVAGFKQIKRKHDRRYREKPSVPRNYAARTRIVEHGYAPLVEKARAYLGKTAAEIGLRRSLWCSAFMRYITKASGVNDLAKSWLVKTPVQPSIGAIAVMSRGRNGGHVGIVSGFDSRGNPIIISGNHGHRVAEAVYSKHRVIAYVSGG